jgi:hypothetical protein
MYRVEYARFGDARETTRTTRDIKRAKDILDAVLMDGGIGRIVWVKR